MASSTSGGISDPPRCVYVPEALTMGRSPIRVYTFKESRASLAAKAIARRWPPGTAANIPISPVPLKKLRRDERRLITTSSLIHRERIQISADSLNPIVVSLGLYPLGATVFLKRRASSEHRVP